MEPVYFSFSEIDTWRQCHFRWQLSYAERWRTDDTPRALAQGTLFHAVLEAQDRRRMDPSVQVWAPGPELNLEDEMEANVDWMTSGYNDFYGDDALYEVLGVEEEFELPMGEFVLRGRIDLVVRHIPTNSIWIRDHKTTSTMPKEADTDFDDQASLYILAKRRQGVDVRGCEFDYVRSKKLVREMSPEERFVRVKTTRTDAELLEVEREAIETMRDAHRERDGDQPRSPNKDTCVWRCSYREACLIGRKRGGSMTRTVLKETGYVSGAMRTERKRIEDLPHEPNTVDDQIDIFGLL